MRDDDLAALHASHTRYEHLRRIVRRYELGELTDGEFKYLKQQLLHGQVPANMQLTSRIDLLLVSYSKLSAMHASIETLRTLPQSIQMRIIDGAVTDRHTSGFVQMRAVPGISKTPSPHDVSIAGAVCGLIFPSESLREEHHARALIRSFGALSWNQVVQHDLRAAGQAIELGTPALILVCWQAVTDTLAAALQGYTALKQVLLHDDVSDAIVAILADARDVH